MPVSVSDDLKNQLREKIQAELTGVQIVDFRATRDVDHDGDLILRLEVIYDALGSAPTAVQTSALPRKIRPWLASRFPDAFPVFRYLNAGEMADEAK